MKRAKKPIIILCLAGASAVFAVFLINYQIYIQSKPYIFSGNSNLPKTEIIIVLGAKVFPDGRISDMFMDRIITAVELYETGKTKKILVSGDHSNKDYDEVNTAKDYLLKHGVKKEDIFLDHAGLDTYDSLYRAREIFKINSATIVTQNFHLPRAVYIGKNLGMEVYGLSADKHFYINIKYSEAREIFADVKAFFDTAIKAKPKFLGPAIPITGDNLKSWD
jgi:vancomycin permeability regulator SanA